MTRLANARLAKFLHGQKAANRTFGRIMYAIKRNVFVAV